MIAAVTDPSPFVHESVLRARVLELFAPVPAGTVVDATLGGAGHAAWARGARTPFPPGPAVHVLTLVPGP